MFYFTKTVREETTRSMDFSQVSEVLSGEVLVSAEVKVALDGRVVNGILVSYALVGTEVRFRVQGGEAGKIYTITALATTDKGHDREGTVLMEVTP